MKRPQTYNQIFEKINSSEIKFDSNEKTSSIISFF